ncbi:nucleoside hydrolase [Bittarella massiliensis (ex Durand et al. 2017)]|uniref:Nucleoside hydrolase n=1 Tax=Bittarella massiliensis (ex Durand et al. 2017) TaxID=1720313 RepID=A0AAW5KH02_9FIRM|nr:nucleoside hydrolase [Bittarella massiliensis (ex Durand et al. 2017)]MCQ4949505.1 nucleoside hydrolase [Bittarella massiliensis (ex Durand et al. 2017)]
MAGGQTVRRGPRRALRRHLIEGLAVLYAALLLFSPQWGIPTGLSERTPVVIDCDPGSDDVLMLGYAAGADLLDVRGITVVGGTGTLAQTGRNALTAAAHFGLHCPVALGAAQTVRGIPFTWPQDAGANGANNLALPWEGGRSFDPRPAWDLLYDLAVEEGGQLQLVCTGPLTNLARALEEHPDLPGYLKRVVVSAGSVDLRAATAAGEYTAGGAGSSLTLTAPDPNGQADPGALEAVLASGLPLYIVGNDRYTAGALSVCKDSWTTFASEPQLYGAIWTYPMNVYKSGGEDNDVPLYGLAALYAVLDEGAYRFAPAQLCPAEGLLERAVPERSVVVYDPAGQMRMMDPTKERETREPVEPNLPSGMFFWEEADYLTPADLEGRTLVRLTGEEEANCHLAVEQRVGTSGAGECAVLGPIFDCRNQLGKKS